MHALRFDHFGDPHVLHVTEMPDPVAGDGEAVIAVKASSVNPSDLQNVAGQFEETSLPRTPGRDFAGIVVDGPRDWAGAEVWGTGGDVGFRHDGPHAEMLTIPAAALAHKPEHLSFEEASTVGVNFVTGWLGVVEAAHLAKGETHRGVRRVRRGGERRRADRPRPGQRGDRDGPDTPRPTVPPPQRSSRISSPSTPARKTSAPRSSGSPAAAAPTWCTTPSAASPRRPRWPRWPARAGSWRSARSAPGRWRSTWSACTAIETRIYGCNSGNYDIVESSTRLQRLAPFFDSGEFHAPATIDRYSLADGEDAYLAVESRGHDRIVICP